ncbi:MAG: hypothetical protein EYC69_10795 [Bacteroidetes bacterium]|nr:MAG: hypothetical protein EYC69_10795 [Bacteroidota bacterium]
MRPFLFLTLLLISCIDLLCFNEAFACSMYKVTIDDKTMVGCNHDTWNQTPRIWFETESYGACFTGARPVGENNFAPQSGMNEFGLAFSRLDAATPLQDDLSANKKQIVNPTEYLKDILHKCRNVEEVKIYVDQYDRSIFIHDVFIYVDRSGKYLIVEPYITTMANDPQYVLANFCPSQIKDFNSIKQTRYINGTTFLKNKLDTSLRFCRELSDTMHVCRQKIGDGTLLTSIWDLKETTTYLYFYHDYEHMVQFNLKEELAKGDHILDITTLFPPNKEFEKLASFKTPLNSFLVDRFLRFCLVLFLFLSFYYLYTYFRKAKSLPYSNIKVGLFLLSSLMSYYIFVLATKINIYYFPAPYQEQDFSLVNVLSFIPFLLLLLLIPLLRFNRKLFREKSWTMISTWILTLNNLVFIALLFLFFYWGFYDIF